MKFIYFRGLSGVESHRSDGTRYMTVRDGTARRRARASERSGNMPHAVAPDEAFKIVGNATRLAILDALWTARDRGSMGFAELRKAVRMRDGSQFNYHLRKLLDGGFVRRVDGRYGIRQSGARVICTVRTGYLTDHPELEPFDTSGRCYACDAPLAARYADEMFFVECSVCDRLHSLGWFPPIALRGRTPEEALLAHERVGKATSTLAAAGICPVCNGTMDRTLARDWSEVPVRSPYLDPERDGSLEAWHVCGHCGVWVSVSPGESVVDHPAVVALYREHGIDVLDRPRWELPWTIDESVLEVVSEDPFRVRVTVTLRDETLVVTLDEAFDAVSVE